MSDGLRGEHGEPLEDREERFDSQGEVTAPEGGWSRITVPWSKIPWPKISWIGLAVVCGVGTSLATSPRELVAAFRSQPQKIVGVDQTEKPADSGRVLKVAEVAPNGLQVAAVGDVVAQQPERLGVEIIDPIRRRPQRSWEHPPVGMVITVPASQGRLLRFEEPIESVFIADPGIADVRVVSADTVYVYGKKTGLTNLMAVSAAPASASRGQTASNDKLTASIQLSVVTDPTPARDGLEDINPGAADNLNVRLFGRRGVVTGAAKNVDQAVDGATLGQIYSAPDQPPVNKTTVEGSNQVNIRVRFAEVSRNDLQSFGIDWNLQGGGGDFKFGVAKQTGGGLTSGGALGGSALNPNLGFNAGNKNFNLEVLIEALKRNGMLNILAEPNLTAVTGKTASFLAGGEVPIPVPQGGNNNAVTVQYKQFGVSLLFTPTMIRPNRIALEVKPEVSSIASTNTFATQGFALPSFTVRRAETTVEVASGQTFAIAGLFQRQTTRNIEKIPLLGDVPILGQLFTSERYQRDETELVILITPTMVEPVSDQSIATPLDREADSPWKPEIVDPTAKGKGFTKTSDQKSGFIFK